MIPANEIGDMGAKTLTNLSQLTNLDLSGKYFWGSTVLVLGVHAMCVLAREFLCGQACVMLHHDTSKQHRGAGREGPCEAQVD